MKCCIDVPYFHELLKNTQVYHAPKPEKKVDPEFAAYMDRLRAEEKERQYKAMIASAVPMRDEAAFSAKDIKEVKSHLATMANIGFSMVAIYFVVYLTSRAIFDDIGYRVLLGLGGAIGIGIVEVLLYLSYINPVARENPKMKLKQKKLQ
ncbi:endoplasmic reticulum-based factor for assembly of V-ATPase-domain-containing protein [Gongronella butleri]|nr:endoplasmic reticulum-based factor for assembly of V-ATPase-domain-containing protein [Gongronella butleri]